MILNRGDIVRVLFPFSSATGARQRPASVVKNDVNNRRMTNVIVAAITTTKHRSGQPTQLLVEFTTPIRQRSGLAHDSVVTCENLATLDKSLVRRKLGTLTDEAMKQIDLCLKVSPGIE